MVNLEDIIVGILGRFGFALRTFSPLFPRPARARDRPSPPTGRPPTFILPVFLRPVVVAFAVVIVDVTVRLDDAEAHERDPIGVIALSHARTQSVLVSRSLCVVETRRTDEHVRRRRALSPLLLPTREKRRTDSTRSEVSRGESRSPASQSEPTPTRRFFGFEDDRSFIILYE